MGIDLVKQVLVLHAAAVSGRAFKVLTYMAATALDKPNSKGQPARLYYAGEEPLAIVLGYRDEPDSPAALRQVRRATRELREAGLIVPTVAHPRAGMRQTWRLTLDDLRLSVADTLRVTDSDTLEGVQNGSSRVSTTDTPRKDSGGVEDKSQDATTRRPAPTPDRARATAADSIELIQPCECPGSHHTKDGDCLRCRGQRAAS